MPHIATVLLFTLTVGTVLGCEGIISSAEPPDGPAELPPPGAPVGPDGFVFQCDAESPQGVHNTSRHMLRVELEQTIEATFGADVRSEVGSALGLVPDANFVESVDEFDEAPSQAYVEAIVAIAFAVPSAVVASPASLTRILPACALNGTSVVLDDAGCRASVVETVGQQVHRRPLTASETQTYGGMLTENTSEEASERFASMLSAMLLNPNFAMLLTYEEQSDAARVDSFTTAERISYAAAARSPDAELYEAASAGALVDEDARRAHAERLLRSPQGRQHVRRIFYNYLRLNELSTPKAEYVEHLGLELNDLSRDLVEEALTFVEHVVFEQEGSFRDLLRDGSAFPPSENTARLMGAPRPSGGVEDPVTDDVIRSGIFMRPVLMLAPEPRTSPIKRGVVFGRTALCVELPFPEDAETEAEARAEDLDPLVITASEEAETLTAGGCQSCHATLNPPGHAFERFGSLGNVRNVEEIFDGDGLFVRELPITIAANFQIDGDVATVASADEMMTLVAESPQAHACFARQVYRLTRLEEEELEFNECQLAELERSVRADDSILSILITNAASESLLWQREQ